MKTKQIISVLCAVLLFTFLSVSCNSEKKGIPGRIDSTKVSELEKIKLKKQHEADSLKKEIEMLKQKKDSLDKALSNGK